MDGAAFLQLTTRLSRRTHAPDPLHLILGLELFGDTLTLCHLLCQQEHLFLCLIVDVSKIGIQPATGQQLCV